MVRSCQDDTKGGMINLSLFPVLWDKALLLPLNSLPSSFSLFWMSASFQEMVFLKGKCYLRGRLYTVLRYESFFLLCLKTKELSLFLYVHKSNIFEVLCKTVPIELKQASTNCVVSIFSVNFQ